MKNKEKLSNKQFAFMMFNYIVGFGFISTVSTVIKLGPWGVAVFFLVSLIALGVMLIFSRLAQEMPKVEGSTYGYSKKAFGRVGSFFQGWNQFIQGPVLGAATPVFLESILKDYDPEHALVYKFLSIGLFLLFISISTLRLKTSFKFIEYFGGVKWILIFGGMLIAIVLMFMDNNFTNSLVNSKEMTVGLITGASLTFVYAFGGIEGMTLMSSSVKTKNFRRLYLKSFIGIFSFYFVFYIILLGVSLQINNENLFRDIFNRAFGVTGVVLFAIGIVANKSSSIIGSTITNGKALAPMAVDGHLPGYIGKTNKNDRYGSAIYTSAIISILMMVLFEVIPEYTNMQGSVFLNIIEIGTIAFLIQYFSTGVIALILEKKQVITKIPTWEKAIYYLMFVGIFFILLTRMIPPVTGESFNTATIVKDASYIGFIGLGLLVSLIVNKGNISEKQVKTA